MESGTIVKQENKMFGVNLIASPYGIVSHWKKRKELCSNSKDLYMSYDMGLFMDFVQVG